jgi:FkbM family methyltransferase
MATRHVEPDRNAFAALLARYGRDNRVKLENVALGSQEGSATFFVEAEGSCYNTLSEKQKDWLLSNRGQNGLRTYAVPVSKLDILIARYGTPDFLKIDVEGYELEVLNGLSHKISVISFEANLPRFRAETLRILERLAREPFARFNLRLGDSFVFSSHVNCERIKGALRTEKEITYDVFIYSRA